MSTTEAPTVELPPADADWPLTTEPWAHQHIAFFWAAGRPAAMLAHGMGGGKSLTAIALAEYWDAQRILVLCPKGVIGVWPAQIEEHAARQWHVWSGQVTGIRGPLASPSVQQRATAIVKHTREAPGLRGWVVSPEFDADHLSADGYSVAIRVTPNGRTDAVALLMPVRVVR